MPAIGPRPPGGDVNRASEIHAFTWTLEIAAMTFVIARMYSRIKLTHNVWWDDYIICLAWLLDLIIAILWSIYANAGYARHLYYLTPIQLTTALELNTISRSMCMISIAVGKISVAFLIERFAGPNRWRRWLLRGISASIFVSAVITLSLFYVQCSPVGANWDHSLVKLGKAKCWDPKAVNTWDLVIASYWAFLDFALAAIPVDMVWKLQLSKQKKFGLSCLLGMGVFAGICAAIKTSKVPITIKATTDITWSTIELLFWNAMEMNIIIIAACIPTLRPLFLILFNRPGAAQYLSDSNKKSPSNSENKNICNICRLQAFKIPSNSSSAAGSLEEDGGKGNPPTIGSADSRSEGRMKAFDYGRFERYVMDDGESAKSGV